MDTILNADVGMYKTAAIIWWASIVSFFNKVFQSVFFSKAIFDHEENKCDYFFQDHLTI